MLSVTNVTLGYNGQPVVKLPGFELEHGGQCLISGPSGSGKTTLLYSIAGLVDVISGDIVVNGVSVPKLSEAGRDHMRGKTIGIIFQTLHLVKSLTVMENLMLAPYMAGLKQDRAHAEAVLVQLGIHEKRNALPSQLSQGQAQRVAIARAMMHNPELILADEPTSSLDDASCDAVIGLIKNTAQIHNASLVISTHDSRLKKHFTNVVTLGVAA